MASGMQGVPQLKAVLAQFPIEIGRKIGRDALMDGARVVVVHLKAAAPSRSGYLKRHIRARMANAREVAKIAGFAGKAARNFSRTPGARAVQIALAGVSKAAYYGGFVSSGWMLTGHKPGKRQIRRIAGTGFLKRGVEMARSQANAVMRQSLANGIEGAAQKLSGSYSGSGFSKRGRTFIR